MYVDWLANKVANLSNTKVFNKDSYHRVFNGMLILDALGVSYIKK